MGTETAKEKLYRLRAMIEPKQRTWDLSNNDVAAIKWALECVESEPKINDAVNKACGELPAGYRIELWIEGHGGGVDLIDSDGVTHDMDLEGDDALSRAIERALSFALETEAEKKESDG